MTILVTGGAGFIGATYVLQKRQNHESLVLNLDKLTYAGNLSTLDSLEFDPDHIFIQGDIGDRQLVVDLLAQYRPSAILNFAAETHVDRSIDGPDDFIQTNIVGTFNLLEATRSYWQQLAFPERNSFRFLHVSTDEVFGSLSAEDPPFAETTAYAPNSPYSASKAGSDHLVRSYFHTYHLPTLITNCSNNYGPYQFPEKLIPLMILNAMEGKPLPVYGDGQNIRDWLFVEDHCRAIDLVLTKGKTGETYNIGGDTEKTNLWLVQQICAILDDLLPHSAHVPHANLITLVEDRPGHDRRYAIDFSKIKQHLGWSPQVTIESGLRRTVQWYLDHQAWCEQVTSDQYECQRLGLSAVKK
ncbi:dTDP-glucose 4,6-dehydratase [Acaryochloris sp. 'Moss Beach']|uniref:dTDP-glucose 4,6-dehydratase n=1 Tax=Acaryochloris sp. 'Moss Beach' TaxID=2740837 RepID=UPI0028F421EE|nr:dTDP-glucose 4,6-dehydratase [Acaryochloris sp. 'Moss Beach']UJB69836.1 dTDP-glucose 4,6-dehydratase [Acaryochloris sp. 'Moss Beach']